MERKRFGEAAALRRSRTKCLPSLEFSCIAVPQTRAQLLPRARKILPSQGSENHVFLSLAAPSLWDNALQSRAGAAVPLSGEGRWHWPCSLLWSLPKAKPQSINTLRKLDKMLCPSPANAETGQDTWPDADRRFLQMGT